ncbi:hypothetical protein SHIRM173S_10129 [Streptomyces hirsutus]
MVESVDVRTGLRSDLVKVRSVRMGGCRGRRTGALLNQAEPHDVADRSQEQGHSLDEPS